MSDTSRIRVPGPDWTGVQRQVNNATQPISFAPRLYAEDEGNELATMLGLPPTRASDHRIMVEQERRLAVFAARLEREQELEIAMRDMVLNESANAIQSRSWNAEVRTLDVSLSREVSEEFVIRDSPEVSSSLSFACTNFVPCSRKMRTRKMRRRKEYHPKRKMRTRKRYDEEEDDEEEDDEEEAMRTDEDIQEEAMRTDEDLDREVLEDLLAEDSDQVSFVF